MSNIPANQHGQPVVPIFVSPFQNQINREQAPILENDRPARMQLALEFLGMMMFKQMDKPAINYGASAGGIEIVPGLKLTTAEANAQASAANCLSEYFAAKVSADRWERSRLEAFKMKRDTEAEQKKIPDAATHIRCPSCLESMTRGSRPSASCPICKGNGTVLVIPGPGENW